MLGKHSAVRMVMHVSRLPLKLKQPTPPACAPRPALRDRPARPPPATAPCGERAWKRRAHQVTSNNLFVVVFMQSAIVGPSPPFLVRWP